MFYEIIIVIYFKQRRVKKIDYLNIKQYITSKNLLVQLTYLKYFA